MVSALVTDIYQRGLDKKVMLVVWGEFGRTPRINKTGGRDHWGPLMSILMAEGGIKVNQVLGASIPEVRRLLICPSILMMFWRQCIGIWAYSQIGIRRRERGVRFLY